MKYTRRPDGGRVDEFVEDGGWIAVRCEIAPQLRHCFAGEHIDDLKLKYKGTQYKGHALVSTSTS